MICCLCLPNLVQAAACVCVCVCVCMYVCVCVHACMYVCVHACMHTCVCVCVCVEHVRHVLGVSVAYSISKASVFVQCGRPHDLQSYIETQI